MYIHIHILSSLYINLSERLQMIVQMDLLVLDQLCAFTFPFCSHL